MKNKYSKPTLSFQSLAITGISSGCSLYSTSTEMVCPVTIPEWGMTYFTDGVCDLIPAEQICYHVPVADSNIFSS